MRNYEVFLLDNHVKGVFTVVSVQLHGDSSTRSSNPSPIAKESKLAGFDVNFQQSNPFER
jgi:hypothetical protein